MPFRQWPPNPTLTIIYVGGNSYNGTVHLQTAYVSGASITLANLSDISENTIYYPFDGYYYDESGTNKISMPFTIASDTTIYARYRRGEHN